MRDAPAREDGFSLVWIAITLMLLLGMAGFGTDLGWLYLNAVRAQNAADAAALAGVVNLPGFDPAHDAEAAARANGYDPGGADTLVLTQTDENELNAELTTSIEPFFMRVFGFTQFGIARDATARYVKPVPLGSPSHCFGGGATGECPATEDFWAAVSGRRTLLEDGDPYSTQCDSNAADGGGGVSCTSSNANYARAGAYSGYYYGVEVGAGMSNLQVLIYDAGFVERGIDIETGDTRLRPGNPPDVHTKYELYPPDDTPLIPDDHLTGGPLCTLTANPGAGTINNWTPLCAVGSPIEGIYLVHVETTNNSSGSNSFAIRATSSGGTPRVYGINDMSIWSNDLVAGSELYLAEIEEDHAGKKLELAFYDAGDARDESWYHVNDPFGNVPTCSWTVWDANYPLPSASRIGGGSGACRWQTQVDDPTSGSGTYNKQWIVAIIDLPDDPADMCNEANPNPCFWKMDLDLAEPTERTTWRARVIGNPVQLIP